MLNGKIAPCPSRLINRARTMFTGIVQATAGIAAIHDRAGLRTFTLDVLDLIERRMREIATHTAAAFGATVQFEFHRNYPPTINHRAEAEFVREAMRAVAGDARTHEFEPTMGAEDFSFFLQAKAGAYFVIGNGDGDHRAHGHGLGPCNLHNPNYDFNDGLIQQGAALWVALARRWLAQD